MKNKLGIILGTVIGLLVIGLFVYPKLKSGGGTDGTTVPCLVPNLPLVQHIHPMLTIEVDGKEEFLPEDIGRRGCERAIHTHDEKGVIHVEAQDSRRYTFGDFMDVWGMSLVREGYALQAAVGGTEIVPEGLMRLELKDEQEIVLEYTSN